jgi:hypothetical protein
MALVRIGSNVKNIRVVRYQSNSVGSSVLLELLWRSLSGHLRFRSCGLLPDSVSIHHSWFSADINVHCNDDVFAHEQAQKQLL